MNQRRRLSAASLFSLALFVLPLVAMAILRVLTKNPTQGIQITGAQIFFTLPMPIQDLVITESQINSWLVVLSLWGLCLFLTRELKVAGGGVRQHLAEWIVEKTDALVKDGMGDYFMRFSPFIAAILGLSGFSSLSSLLGAYPPTSDLNVVAGWAILVFILITYYKSKCGPGSYLKSFAQPVAFLTPLNVISEVATPLSMAFRHYGNVLSGSVIGVLVASALQGLSAIVLGWLPGVLGQFPLLQVGLPAILSLYFDLFSSLLQAYIFAMLTMMYVAGAFPMEDYLARKEKQKKKTISGGNQQC